jgi:hypothetical protein
MKNLLAFTLLFITSFLFAQSTTFEFSKEGFTDFVVTDTPNLTANEIYLKTINWIKENYKNPDEVIKMTIENEKLRFEGVRENALCVKAMGNVCSSARYVIEVSFKDGRYKFDPISVSFFNQMGNGYNVPMNETGKVYYKNGKILKGSEEVPEMFESLFNGLNESLKNYVLGVNKKIDEDW